MLVIINELHYFGEVLHRPKTVVEGGGRGVLGEGNEEIKERKDKIYLL